MFIAMLLTALINPPDSLNIAAPELEKVSAWVNSSPLKLAEQKGKVVVLHFFAFG